MEVCIATWNTSYVVQKKKNNKNWSLDIIENFEHHNLNKFINGKSGWDVSMLEESLCINTMPYDIIIYVFKGYYLKLLDTLH